MPELRPEPRSDRPAPAGLRIGHVHLKVSDLERSVAFWRDTLGFDVMQRIAGAAFLAAGGYHHHIGLNTWDSEGGSAPARDRTGLYHVALLYPTRADLGRALQRVLDAGVRLTGASDHGVSIALYLDDPDGNGIELYWDRPQEDWPVIGDGQLNMGNKRVDLEALLAEGRGVA
jgi:catechol 2,3-dioxygenase